MSQARPIHPGTTYFITRRTERRHCLLRPDSRINAFIRYAIIVAARRHGILLHALCTMSTHVHYVVTDPRGVLPRFLEMFHRLVALGVKSIRNWDGAVWDRSQTSAVALHTREAIVEKIAYTLANPVSAGLVWSAHEWPGARTVVDDISNREINASRPSECFSPNNSEWEDHVALAISLPPSIPRENAHHFRNEVHATLAELEAAAHKGFPRHKVLGAMRAMRIAPETRITTRKPSRQRNPSFATGKGNAEAARKAVKALQDFRTAYRKALDAWRAGDRTITFPAGTYAMRVFHGVNIAIP